MSRTYKMTLLAGREAIEAALVAHEDMPEWDFDIVLAGTELAEDRPDDWKLEAWLPRKPTARDKAAIAGLFAQDAPEIAVEAIVDEDWVTRSQSDLQPIRAARFVVRTPEHPAQDEPGTVEFVIPASQAFGTGHHNTTAGCLTMLDAMKRRGVIVRNHLDVGTGTGVLAFAAMALWPRASATASDIDAVCVDVVAENARANGFGLGGAPRRIGDDDRGRARQSADRGARTL